MSLDFMGTHASSGLEGKLSMVIGDDMVEGVLKYDHKCEGFILLSIEPCALPCCWAWLLLRPCGLRAFGAFQVRANCT